jgi:hypothetical protein
MRTFRDGARKLPKSLMMRAAQESAFFRIENCGLQANLAGMRARDVTKVRIDDGG